MRGAAAPRTGGVPQPSFCDLALEIRPAVALTRLARRKARHPHRTFPSRQPLPLTDRAQLAPNLRALVRQLALERVDVLPAAPDQLELAVDVPERLLEDLAAA